MISWDEIGGFVERVIGKRPHTGDALPKALFSWDELADFVERVTGKRPHTGDALPKALSGLPEAYDQLQAENERLREALHAIVKEEDTWGWLPAARAALIALKEENNTRKETMDKPELKQDSDGTWYVEGNVGTVKGDVRRVEGNVGYVEGTITRYVTGNVGRVKGNVRCVEGRVWGTINGRGWTFVEENNDE